MRSAWTTYNWYFKARQSVMQLDQRQEDEMGSIQRGRFVQEAHALLMVVIEAAAHSPARCTPAYTRPLL